MIDRRFYACLGPVSALELAAEAGSGVVEGGEDRQVSSVAPSLEAGPDDLSFLEDRSPDALRQVRAGICFVRPETLSGRRDGTTCIVSERPRAAFARASERIFRRIDFQPGDPAIHPTARIEAGAKILPGCVIGAGAAIGSGATIGPNAVIGPGVQIGWRSRIGAGASVSCALIGDDVILLAGVAIGETGFGLAQHADGARLTPHFGRVILQNGVTIGANSCVDRGLFDDTVIGEGSHIDNLCHIGHNVRIGRHAVMAAFAGVSGSSIVGDGAQFGGRVGLGDHIVVGRGARIAAGAAVLKDVAEGETVAGYPAKPSRTWMRELAWLAREAQKRGSKDD
ncbi:MAG: UDP-3-O-(3-hydroxymyristoyl)glucosamine N-acyltransferase [Alphaproteobacteria bacterium]|nr:UDP-3-O-(3-hydroxymyristoyl)glucosamine N-acyltransferase [Alphaproteobacteria bacterium]